MKENGAHMTPQFFENALRYLQGFMPEFTLQDLRVLMQYCEVRKFPRRTMLLKEGEVENYLNMVTTGLVRKFYKAGKNEQTLQLATEGHVVHSELSFLTRNLSLVSLQTLEDTVMVSLRFDKMEEALEKFEHGERMGRLILTAMYIKKDERRYARASKPIRQLFLDYLAHHPHMIQRVPQKYLASYLNIKPETFSRLKKLAYR